MSDLPAKIGGMVPRGEGEGLFQPTDYVEAKELRRNDDFIIYGIAAAVQAVEDSGWKPEDEEERCRTGVLIGSGIGGLNTIADTTLILEKGGPRRVSPFFIPAALINLASGQVSIRYGFKGPNHAVVTACSTGAHAIGDAARLIALDDADVMVAGGCEAALGPDRHGRLRRRARALDRLQRHARRGPRAPGTRTATASSWREGAGCVVLEEYEHAKRRGAKIYAEVKGYGLSGDAYHVTAPSPDGRRRLPLDAGGAQARGPAAPDDIDYINAHGTSTPLGDEIELGAVKRLFGNAVAKLSMSSTKSAIGHLLGAAGAVEAIFCILALRDQIVPPTLNLDNPSDGCGDVDLVPHQAKEREVRATLSNSFGFGGTNASVIFTAVN